MRSECRIDKGTEILRNQFSRIGFVAFNESTQESRMAPQGVPQKDRLEEQEELALKMTVGPVSFWCRALGRTRVAGRRTRNALVPNGTGTLRVKRSKTDQGGEGAILPLPRDAVRRITAWIKRARIDNGPLFRKIEATRDGQYVIKTVPISPW